MALEKEKEKGANKRHTLSNPPDHIPDLDSPRQSRSPLKKDKKEKVSQRQNRLIRIGIRKIRFFHHFLLHFYVELVKLQLCLELHLLFDWKINFPCITLFINCCVTILTSANIFFKPKTVLIILKPTNYTSSWSENQVLVRLHSHLRALLRVNMKRLELIWMSRLTQYIQFY